MESGSKMTPIKIPGVQIRWYTSLMTQRIRAHWIYDFLKQRSHKHKLQETFTVLHASWRRHSTFDPWTVKTTAGIYKGGEKMRPTSPVKIGRWKRFSAQAYRIHQRVIFTAFNPPQVDANYSCIRVISRSEMQPAVYKYTDVQPRFTPSSLHSHPVMASMHRLFLCYFQYHYCSRRFEIITRLYTLEVILKLLSWALEIQEQHSRNWRGKSLKHSGVPPLNSLTSSPGAPVVLCPSTFNP